jgi:hypothetical protein
MLRSGTYHIYPSIVHIQLHQDVSKSLCLFFSLVTDLRLCGNNIFYTNFYTFSYYLSIGYS